MEARAQARANVKENIKCSKLVAIRERCKTGVSTFFFFFFLVGSVRGVSTDKKRKNNVLIGDWKN